MKYQYITPKTEVVAFDGPDFICTSTVPGEVVLPMEGAAIDNNVTDGDSRFIDFLFTNQQQ